MPQRLHGRVARVRRRLRSRKGRRAARPWPQSPHSHPRPCRSLEQMQTQSLACQSAAPSEVAGRPADQARPSGPCRRPAPAEPWRRCRPCAPRPTGQSICSDSLKAVEPATCDCDDVQKENAQHTRTTRV
eukprot:scaffold23796_cov144-Isochrysis_galbana.AAC.1